MITRMPVIRVLSSPISRALNASKSPAIVQSVARCYSTPVQQPPPPLESPAPPKPIDLRSQISANSGIPPNPYFTPLPKARRSLRPYIYATLFTFLGFTVGQYITLVVLPPPLIEPSSDDDIKMVEFLTSQAERLPIVKSMAEDTEWTLLEGYSRLSEEERKHVLTTGPMGGSRGLGGYRKTWVHKDTGECVTVIWIGGALAGWPGVTHGGVTASILDEALGTCAILQFPAKTGVTANLEVNYLKPVVTNSFYVLRAIPIKEGGRDNKMWVSGRLETVEGRTCVEAKALFVVPRKFTTRRLE